MVELISAASRLHAGARCGLDGLLSNVSFRWRLLRMALSRLDNIPATVVMALETPECDTSWLSGGCAPLVTEPVQGAGTSSQGVARSQGAAQVGMNGREHAR